MYCEKPNNKIDGLNTLKCRILAFVLNVSSDYQIIKCNILCTQLFSFVLNCLNTSGVMQNTEYDNNCVKMKTFQIIVKQW